MTSVRKDGIHLPSHKTSEEPGQCTVQHGGRLKPNCFQNCCQTSGQLPFWPSPLSIRFNCLSEAEMHPLKLQRLVSSVVDPWEHDSKPHERHEFSSQFQIPRS